MSSFQVNIKDFMPPIIIAIVGPSGSGKTTMANIMQENGIPTIVSYTTRPMREGEANGREHWFVDEKQIPPKSEMLAYTKFGGYEYWAKCSQVKKLCTYVIDEVGLRELIKEYGWRYIIFSIYLDRTLETRLQDGIDEERCNRDKEREQIDSSEYNCTINNHYTLEEFTSKVKELSNELLKL